MMTRRCAGRDCLVSLSTCTASGNPRLRREGQACCGRAISYPDRRCHRSSERSPLFGARGNGVRRSGIGHRRYSLCGVVPGAWEEGDNPHDLARSTTRKSLIWNRVFQNDETKGNENRQFFLRRWFLVAPAFRRRFFRALNTVPARHRNPVASRTFSPLQSLTRSGRMNGRS